MKKFWDGLSPNMKVLVVLIAIVVLWFFWQKISAFFTVQKKQIQEKTEIQVLQEKGVKPTYSAETYKKFADNMYNAMNGPGTTDQVILAVFSYLHNDLDFIKLDAAFGVRGADDDLFGLIDPTDMRGWLKDDLSEPVITSLNNTLKNKGITKRI